MPTSWLRRQTEVSGEFSILGTSIRNTSLNKLDNVYTKDVRFDLQTANATNIVMLLEEELEVHVFKKLTSELDRLVETEAITFVDYITCAASIINNTSSN